MMEWFNNYSHGFMFVGRKPHLFGNDRNTIFWIGVNNLESKHCRREILYSTERCTKSSVTWQVCWTDVKNVKTYLWFRKGYIV